MNKNYSIPVLSSDRTTCTVGNTEIKVKQSIDYKSATDRRTSVGRIEGFMYAGYRQEDKSSVWMRVVDLQDEGQSEWVSVCLWKQQVDNGLFLNTKPESNASPKQEASQEYPF